MAVQLRPGFGVMALVRGCALLAFVGTFSHAASATDSAKLSLNWPFEVVFDTPPSAAKPRPGSACEVALLYATFITNGQAEKVPSLFAADGAFIGPENRVLRGKEIFAFYNSVQQRGAIPISFIDGETECVMELANLRPVAGSESHKYMLSAIDHFTVNGDKKIERLVIFFRENIISPPHPETGGAVKHRRSIIP